MRRISRETGQAAAAACCHVVEVLRTVLVGSPVAVDLDLPLEHEVRAVGDVPLELSPGRHEGPDGMGGRRMGRGRGQDAQAAAHEVVGVGAAHVGGRAPRDDEACAPAAEPQAGHTAPAAVGPGGCGGRDGGYSCRPARRLCSCWSCPRRRTASCGRVSCSPRPCSPRCSSPAAPAQRPSGRLLAAGVWSGRTLQKVSQLHLPKSMWCWAWAPSAAPSTAASRASGAIPRD